VHPIRIGRIVRTLRRRLRWRQLDVAHRAGVSQQLVSLIETGQMRRVSIDTLERVLACLEIELDFMARWRGGEIDRLLDEDHAALVAATADRLTRSGWQVEVEVTYAIGRERGSIDLMAYHHRLAALLIGEIKSDVTAAEATLRKHDEKVRLGAQIARERFGWSATSVSRLLVVPESTTSRRRIERHAALFDRAYPLRGRAVQVWLLEPAMGRSALLFLPLTKRAGVGRGVASRRRVAAARRRSA
jgi:transcriptional regulator with XRE-family HTH domain